MDRRSEKAVFCNPEQPEVTMEFLDFAVSNGLVIKRFQTGKISRCSTLTHPQKENGAYFFEGDFGWVQDWAQDETPRFWKLDKPRTAAEEADFAERVKKSAERHQREKREAQRKAAEKALWIMSQCKIEPHAYLYKKGFPELSGAVFRPTEDQNLLIIPMRSDQKVAGCQMIDRDGNKKFLFGQQCRGAEFRIGAGKLHIYCEGYATGLSIAEALKALKTPFTLHVTFSCQNMILIAQRGPKGLVVADNDKSGAGERAARDIGYPYFLPPNGDFNDFWLENGTFRSSQALKKVLTICK